METWNVDNITLWDRNARPSALSATLACGAVAWHPAGDIPQDSDHEAGYLLAEDVAVERLADIGWTPTHVTFRARRFMEEREFEVSGLEADPEARTVRFKLP
jgi:hypothetical protein